MANSGNIQQCTVMKLKSEQYIFRLAEIRFILWYLFRSSYPRNDKIIPETQTRSSIFSVSSPKTNPKWSRVGFFPNATKVDVVVSMWFLAGKMPLFPKRPKTVIKYSHSRSFESIMHEIIYNLDFDSKMTRTPPSKHHTLTLKTSSSYQEFHHWPQWYLTFYFQSSYQHNSPR